MELENEDDDPAGGQTRDPVALFTALAVSHGLIRAGDKLDQNMIDFADDIVELCATVGDGYSDAEAGGNAGEHIRALYWER